MRIGGALVWLFGACRSLILGFTCGFFLYFLLTIYGRSLSSPYFTSPYIPDWSNARDTNTDGDRTSSPNATVLPTVSEYLHGRVRVMCLIMTQPNNTIKAEAVKATWAARCNKFVFVSSETNASLPSIDAKLNESRGILWGKTKFAFSYAYQMLSEYDWFMKADDDTYVVVDNLRALLSNFSPNEPTVFGCQFNKSSPQGYMSGGAGYVLSRRGLRLLVEHGLNNRSICRQDNGGNEDWEMGVCLYNVGVKAMDSRDANGAGRFFPLSPEQHMAVGHMTRIWWYSDYLMYPEKDLLDCCSQNAVSFHYIKWMEMYEMEYYLYHLNPFGVDTPISSVDLEEIPLHDDYGKLSSIDLANQCRTSVCVICLCFFFLINQKMANK